MAASNQNTTIVATEATPIALGANAGATDVWTWTHNLGRKASKVTAIDALTRQPIASPDIVAGGTLVGKAVTVLTNSTTVIAIQNISANAVNVILEIVWAYDSEQLDAPVLGAVGVLS